MEWGLGLCSVGVPEEKNKKQFDKTWDSNGKKFAIGGVTEFQTLQQQLPPPPPRLCKHTMNTE